MEMFMDDETAGGQGKTLAQVLAEAKSRGKIEMRDGEDVYDITYRRGKITEKTRDYLLTGGTDAD